MSGQTTIAMAARATLARLCRDSHRADRLGAFRPRQGVVTGLVRAILRDLNRRTTTGCFWSKSADMPHDVVRHLSEDDSQTSFGPTGVKSLRKSKCVG